MIMKGNNSEVNITNLKQIKQIDIYSMIVPNKLMEISDRADKITHWK